MNQNEPIESKNTIEYSANKTIDELYCGLAVFNDQGLIYTVFNSVEAAKSFVEHDNDDVAVASFEYEDDQEDLDEKLDSFLLSYHKLDDDARLAYSNLLKSLSLASVINVDDRCDLWSWDLEPDAGNIISTKWTDDEGFYEVNINYDDITNITQNEVGLYHVETLNDTYTITTSVTKRV